MPGINICALFTGAAIAGAGNAGSYQTNPTNSFVWRIEPGQGYCMERVHRAFGETNASLTKGLTSDVTCDTSTDALVPFRGRGNTARGRSESGCDEAQNFGRQNGLGGGGDVATGPIVTKKWN
uniref:Uncharacterized protein n=1 Tax=Eutreptiella gymnastica TaxID=73025 RepID=A0A7S4G547_9EUGL